MTAGLYYRTCYSILNTRELAQNCDIDITCLSEESNSNSLISALKISCILILSNVCWNHTILIKSISRLLIFELIWRRKLTELSIWNKEEEKTDKRHKTEDSNPMLMVSARYYIDFCVEQDPLSMILVCTGFVSVNVQPRCLIVFTLNSIFSLPLLHLL